MAWHSVRFEYLSESDCFIACLGYASSLFETSKRYLRYMYLLFSDHDDLSLVFSMAVLPDCDIALIQSELCAACDVKQTRLRIVNWKRHVHKVSQMAGPRSIPS